MNLSPAAIALAEEAQGIQEHPWASNAGVPSERYQRGVRAVPWCSYFVMWCYDEAGWRCLYDNKTPEWDKPNVRVPRDFYMMAAARTLMDTWTERGHGVGRFAGLPQPSDIICMKRYGGSGVHVGIVTKCAGGMVEHVDGNLGHRVAMDAHSLDDELVLGYLRFR